MDEEVAKTLIAKLALVMPGYSNDEDGDFNGPYLIVGAWPEGISIVPLSDEENALLQKTMQEVKSVGDQSVETRRY